MTSTTRKWLSDVPCWLRITHPDYPSEIEKNKTIFDWRGWDEEIINLREVEKLTWERIGKRVHLAQSTVRARYIQLKKDIA